MDNKSYAGRPLSEQLLMAQNEAKKRNNELSRNRTFGKDNINKVQQTNVSVNNKTNDR